MQESTISLKGLKQSFSSQTIKQKWLFLLYTFLLIPNSLAIIRAFEMRVGLSFFTPISNGVFITIAILGCFGLFWKCIRFYDILFLLVVIGIYFASALIFPNTASLSDDNAGYFILSCLPMYLVGLSINEKTSGEMFVIMSYVALTLQIVFLGVLGMGFDEEGNQIEEMMSAAYGLLPFTLILLWYAFEKGGVFNYLMGIIGVFVLVSLGTRGPIVCLFTFVALYFIFYKTYKYDILVKSLIAIVASLFLFFSNEIALELGPLAEYFGLSTRVFESTIEGQMLNIYQSNGRDEIWGEAFNYLTNNNVLFGEGLYADRLISSSSGYAHNLEIELLCSFGWVGGIFVILLLAALIYKAFVRSRNTEGSIILLVFFCASVIQLQISGSFLRSQVFWLFIGMCVTMQRINRTIN